VYRTFFFLILFLPGGFFPFFPLDPDPACFWCPSSDPFRPEPVCFVTSGTNGSLIRPCPSPFRQVTLFFFEIGLIVLSSGRISCFFRSPVVESRLISPSSLPSTPPPRQVLAGSKGFFLRKAKASHLLISCFPFGLGKTCFSASFSCAFHLPFWNPLLWRRTVISLPPSFMVPPGGDCVAPIPFVFRFFPVRFVSSVRWGWFSGPRIEGDRFRPVSRIPLYPCLVEFFYFLSFSNVPSRGLGFLRPHDGLCLLTAFVCASSTSFPWSLFHEAARILLPPQRGLLVSHRGLSLFSARPVRAESGFFSTGRRAPRLSGSWLPLFFRGCEA